MIMATVEHRSDVLRVLVDAGSDLNVQNEVRYTVTVASAAGVIPSCPYLGGSDCCNDLSKQWEK